MEATVHQVTSKDGTTIAYETSGSGPHLVLSHGTGAPGARWPAVAGLEQQFTVHAVQRRGRGHSGDTEPYALEREFEDLAAVVDAIGGPVSLLGHSYGALCALGAALLTPGLHKLILYEPPAFVDEDGALVVGVPPDLGFDIDAVLAQLQAQMEAGREQGVTFFLQSLGGMSPEMVRDLRAQPTWPARLEAAPTILREMQQPLGTRIGPARLKQLVVPIVCLVGEESPPWRRASTEALASVLPDAEVVVLPGQGHLAMFDAPELFARRVGELLHGVVA